MDGWNIAQRNAALGFVSSKLHKELTSKCTLDKENNRCGRDTFDLHNPAYLLAWLSWQAGTVNWEPPCCRPFFLEVGAGAAIWATNYQEGQRSSWTVSRCWTDVGWCFWLFWMSRSPAAWCSFLQIQWSDASAACPILSEEFIDLVRAQIEKILTGRASQQERFTGTSCEAKR